LKLVTAATLLGLNCLEQNRRDDPDERRRDDACQQIRRLEGVAVIDDDSAEPGDADLHLSDHHADQRLAQCDSKPREDVRDGIRQLHVRDDLKRVELVDPPDVEECR
jgi:hypothetical protein